MSGFATAAELQAMSAGDWLAYLGQDARKWAKAFIAINSAANVDEGLMIAWFANALCVGEDHGLARCGKIDPMWQRPWDRDQ